MIDALLYLQWTSLHNAVRARLQRLRRPRYLVATLVGAAYFYFFFFRHLIFRGVPPPGRMPMPAADAFFVGLIVALMLAGRLVYAWIISAERAALAFTPAEVAFLFPAPISRRRLVHFKLVKSQLRILFSAVLLGLLSNRFNLLGGNSWSHAVGWWIVFSTLELHGIAASFTRERLLDLGFNPWRRRLWFGGALVLLAVGLGWWLLRTAPPPPAAGPAGPAAVFAYARLVAATPPLPWLLAPFRWVAGPLLAGDALTFLRTLGPALLILGLHYVWVIRAEVSFEEASLELSRRRAERIAAVRAGKSWKGERPARRRGDPFRLRPAGPAPVAFLWKNFISTGPWFYPRNWLLFSVAVLAVVGWLAARPASRPWLPIVQYTALPIGVWALLFIPMLMRRQVHLLIERLDVIKTHPLRGWQVVLGEMLGPVVLITAIEWLLLAVTAVAAGATGSHLPRVAWMAGFGGVGISLLVPPVAGLMIAIPFAATLYFPGWMASVNQPRGMETMGQRLIFSGAFLLTLTAALLPAALAGLGPCLLLEWLTDTWAVALLVGAITAGVVLAAELAAVVWWLGRRYDQFDLSLELPQG